MVWQIALVVVVLGILIYIKYKHHYKKRENPPKQWEGETEEELEEREMRRRRRSISEEAEDGGRFNGEEIRMRIGIGTILMVFLCLGCSAEESVMDILQERDYEAILHHDKVDHGMVVLFESDEALETVFLKETSSGWRATNDQGGHTVHNFEFTTSQALLPIEDQSPFPLLFGKITNEKVKRIKVQFEGEEKHPEIMEKQGSLYWFLYLDHVEKDSQFLLKGYKENHELVDEFEFNLEQSSETSNKAL